MRITFYSKNSRCPEFRYAVDVIFGFWLGFDIEFLPNYSGYTEFEIEGSKERMLLPDVFFGSHYDGEFASDRFSNILSSGEYKLPVELAQRLGLSHIPAVFDVVGIDLSAKNVLMPVDVIGLVFFFLSRFEEYNAPVLDEHGRFPGAQSLMSKLGCLHVPIVDIYVEILWFKIQEVFPWLRRKELSYRRNISCDVDSPFLYHKTTRNLIKRAGGDVWHRGSFRQAGVTLQAILSGEAAYARDPYALAVDFIVRENDKVGNQVQFNFIPCAYNARFDGVGRFRSAEVRAMIQRVSSEGHEVGIHPGYDTMDNALMLSNSVKEFLDVCPSTHSLKGRQHYLRWQVGKTELLYEAAGIRVDSTLGYADTGGFRSGTCRSHPLFSLTEHRMLNLIEDPLLIMENTFFASKYLGYGVSNEALEKMLEVKRWCKKLKGVFTVLWHNSSLVTDTERDIYLEIIK